jgi:hypothetical protein
MEKKRYEQIKTIKEKIKRGQPTTFHERNIVNITEKNKTKKLKNSL